MAISDVQVKIKPLTGFQNIDYHEASKSAYTPVPVVSPVVPYELTPRATSLSTYNNQVTLLDVQAGWYVDSYLRQAVSKYTEKIVKEGFILAGDNTSAVAYVQTRLDLMTYSTGNSWWATFVSAIRDYIKFGNAFLAKAYLTGGLPALKKKGMRRTTGGNNAGGKPVGGYFNVNPLAVVVLPDPTDYTHQMGWRYTSAGKIIDFPVEDFLHWTYDKQSSGVWGVSMLVPVLDDVRALRQSEEMVTHLLFKSLNPLIHQEVPDSTGTGLGRQSDVTAAAAQLNLSPVNGYLVTPPGHKLNILGVESKALRAEGYLRFMRQRVYAGLGLSELIMGDSSTGVGTNSSLSALMHDHVRFCQKEIADYITHDIIWELLIEGGFDPILNEKDRVFWVFNEVDADLRIKEETHTALLWTQNLLTQSEARLDTGRPILPESDESGLYVNKVTIPATIAYSAASSYSAPSTGATNLTGGRNKTPSTNNDADYVHSLRSFLDNFIVETHGRQGGVSNTECLQALSIAIAQADSQFGSVSLGTKQLVLHALTVSLSCINTSWAAADILFKLHSDSSMLAGA